MDKRDELKLNNNWKMWLKRESVIQWNKLEWEI
jgi:hypothetical protein